MAEMMRATFLGVYRSPVLLESRCCMKVLRLTTETVEEPEERDLKNPKNKTFSHSMAVFINC